jgi:hypothetical protein
VCGQDVDQNLVSLAADLDWAKQQGVAIERFNLAQQPMDFAENATVKAFLERSGAEALPLVLVDGEVAGRPLPEPRRADALGWPGRAGSARSKAEVAPQAVAAPAANAVEPHTPTCIPSRPHEFSATAAPLPVLHRQGRRRQDLDRLRHGHRTGARASACCWSAPTRPPTWGRCSASPSATTSRPCRRAGPGALEIDPQAAAQAYRDRIVGPVRGVLPDDVVRGIEEQLSGACTTEIAAFDEFTAC